MKRKNFVYLAAALLILNTVIRFILDFSGDYPYNVFGTFSIIIIPLLLSVVLITQHSNKTIVGISILVFAVLNFLLAARGFGMVSVDTSYIIPYIILPLINLINGVFLSLGLFKSKSKDHDSDYLFIYILLPLAYIVLYFIPNYISLRSIMLLLLHVGFYVFLGLYVTYKPKKRRSNEASGTNGHKAHSSTDGYISMGKHIVLCVFTFGIWYLIWIYRTTEFLNKAPDSEEYSPTSKLLLCMFVPFYIIFWTYEHGKRIDRLAKENRVSSDIATVSLVLGIFIPIVACIIMQDKINSISTAIARKRRSMARKSTESLEQQKTVTRSVVNEITNSNATNADGCDTETPDTDSYDAEISDIEECDSEVSNTDVLSAPSEKTTPNPYSEIKQLKELLDMGIITQEEFNTKKKQLLGL